MRPSSGDCEVVRRHMLYSPVSLRLAVKVVLTTECYRAGKHSGNALCTYCGGARFESRLGTPTILIEILFLFYSVPLGKCQACASTMLRPLPSKSFAVYSLICGPTTRYCVVQVAVL
jgi:hypothetical protein